MEKNIDNELVSVRSFLDKFCIRYADRTFFCVLRNGAEVSQTYRQLREDSLSLAKTFLSLGYRGKHLALLSENRYEFAVLFFASLLSGTVFVPIDISAPPEEIGEMLSFADVDVVFCTSATEKLTSFPDKFLLESTFSEWIEKGKTLPEPSFCGDFSDGETAMLCFTSGTTAGKKKCVMLTAGNVFTPATHQIWRYFAYMEGTDGRAGVYSPLPMFHLAGLICAAVNITIPNGSTFMTSPRPASAFRDIFRLNPHFVLAVPALVDAVCSIMEQDGTHPSLPRLKEISICGAKATPSLISRLHAFGLFVGCDYGMTECAPQVTIAASRIGANPESVGVPCSFNELSIWDGVLYVRGENVMKGYYKNPEATAEALSPDGWFCTGDLAEIDDDGCLYIKGRANSVVILSNGDNIDVDELSVTFLNAPAIGEIVLLPDARHHNDTLVALIYPAEGETQETVSAAVAAVNRTLPVKKRVSRFRLVDKPFEKNEMLKIKRYLYRDEIV